VLSEGFGAVRPTVNRSPASPTSSDRRLHSHRPTEQLRGPLEPAPCQASTGVGRVTAISRMDDESVLSEGFGAVRPTVNRSPASPTSSDRRLHSHRPTEQLRGPLEPAPCQASTGVGRVRAISCAVPGDG
jgi:hypothetical protein